MATTMTQSQWESTSDVQSNKGAVNQVYVEKKGGIKHGVWDRLLRYGYGYKLGVGDNSDEFYAAPRNASTLEIYKPLSNYFGTIPTIVPTGAMNDSEALCEVDLHEEFTEIETYALSNCTNLTIVSAPSVTTLGTYAFSGCTSLEGISLPKVTTLGNHAFSGCTNLGSVSLPEATTISQRAFSGCASLKEINIPKVTSIENYAFTNCGFVGRLTLPSTLRNIGKYAFAGSSNLTGLVFSGPLSSAGDYALDSTKVATLDSAGVTSSIIRIGLFSAPNVTLYYKLTYSVSRAGPSTVKTITGKLSNTGQITDSTGSGNTITSSTPSISNLLISVSPFA